MDKALARQILLACASGVLYPLCFPDFDLGFLAWVLLVPLHFAIEPASPRQAFRIGWLAGLIGFTGTMSWVVTAMHLYGKMPLAASYAVMVVLTTYLGLYVALYAAGYTWLKRMAPSVLFLTAPSLWVSLELLRTYVLSGLPWALLGYSQYQWLSIIQIADHTGVYGVSFLIVLVNLALTELISWVFARLRRDQVGLAWQAPAAALLAMAIAGIYGHSALQVDARSLDVRTLSIGLVQANIDQAHKWDVAYREETLERYRRLTAQVAARSDLIIWPEAATPFLFELEPQYRSEVTAMAQAARAPILFGSPALRYTPDRRPYLLNSAYLLSPAGEIQGRYDKQHLVPFGEYIPLHSSVLFFLDKLVEGIGDFEAGTTPTILTVRPLAASSPHADDQKPEVKFGVVICYEVIFPDLVRQFALNGAEFMATITNDAWFGRSAAPYQHFGMVVFRSVENRVAFARAANTGVSGFIDPSGRILSATPIFTEAVLMGSIPVQRRPTFYTRYGDAFGYGCVIITGLFLTAARFRRNGHDHRQ
ncbi:MAG TPA: apolipoprotein N-acyltransferase [Nitrospiraceae bacterium]|jgi:apolipoprotein N-acyltransferase|nr:apolipoprotein N-acyltransferase [Nitrospiraceae bacterium]